MNKNAFTDNFDFVFTILQYVHGEIRRPE